MDRATIPEEHHGAPQVAKQMPKKGPDVEPGEIPGLAAQVQRQPPVFGRHRHAAADREPVVAVAVEQARRLPSRRPGSANVGNEQKPALIDEYEMGAATRGVFLSGAIPCTSSAQWRPHPARPRGARAFGSSSPRPSALSRRGRDGSESRTPGRSVWPPAAASRDRSGSPPAADPSRAAGRVALSGAGTISGAGQASLWPPGPVAPRAD